MCKYHIWLLEQLLINQSNHSPQLRDLLICKRSKRREVGGLYKRKFYFQDFPAAGEKVAFSRNYVQQPIVRPTASGESRKFFSPVFSCALITSCRCPSLAPCCGNRQSSVDEPPGDSNRPQLKQRKLRKIQLQITSRKLQKVYRESLLLLARQLVVLLRVLGMHLERLVAGRED